MVPTYWYWLISSETYQSYLGAQDIHEANNPVSQLSAVRTRDIELRHTLKMPEVRGRPSHLYLLTPATCANCQADHPGNFTKCLAYKKRLDRLKGQNPANKIRSLCWSLHPQPMPGKGNGSDKPIEISHSSQTRQSPSAKSFK